MARERGEQFAWRFNDLPSFPALVNVNRTRWETDRCYSATEVLPQQCFPLHRTQTLRITITFIRYKNVCFCSNFHDKKNVKNYEYTITSIIHVYNSWDIKDYFINFIVNSETLLNLILMIVVELFIMKIWKKQTGTLFCIHLFLW